MTSHDEEERLLRSVALQNAQSSPTATDSFLYDCEGKRVA